MTSKNTYLPDQLQNILAFESLPDRLPIHDRPYGFEVIRLDVLILLSAKASKPLPEGNMRVPKHLHQAMLYPALRDPDSNRQLSRKMEEYRSSDDFNFTILLFNEPSPTAALYSSKDAVECSNEFIERSIFRSDSILDRARRILILLWRNEVLPEQLSSARLLQR